MRDVQYFRSFVDGQPRQIAQFGNLRVSGFQAGKTGQGLIQD